VLYQKWGAKKFLLFCVWFFCFVTFILFFSNRRVTSSPSQTFFEDLSFENNNSLGGFRIVKCLDNDPAKKAYSISFKKMRSDSHTIGVFKTPLKRNVEIENLCLSFFNYDTSKEFQQGKGYNTELFENAEYTTDLIRNCISSFQKKFNKFSISIDLSNIAGAKIYGFSYNLFHEDDLSLSVQAKIATIGEGLPKVDLRGHAQITDSEESTLISNHIIWDVKKKSFTAHKYCLIHNGEKITGSLLTVDYELNELSNVNIVNNKEEYRCFAQANHY
jgi:hypothetical protein